MRTSNEKFITIANKSQLDGLLKRFDQKQMFDHKFKFSERSLFVSLLEALGIVYEDFIKKYHYFDKTRNLHY